MARRLGMILAIAAVALLAGANGLWACGCLNRLMNSCGGHRVVECSACCGPVVYCDPCCQPVATPAGSDAATSTAAPAQPAPAVAPPIAIPKSQQASPAGASDLKPETPPEPKSSPRHESTAPVMKPPVLAPPKEKEVETPAELRVAKPAAPPVVAPPTLPDQPPLPIPKAPAIEDPLVPTPPKTDESKPGTPDKKPAKDDPFGASNDQKPLRLWTDASGKYRIEARFVSFQDRAVRLQKADGRYVRIEFDLLCSADRNYVVHQDGTLYAME